MKISNQYSEPTPYLFHTCYKSQQSQPLWFNQPNNIRWRAHNLKLLNLYFFPFFLSPSSIQVKVTTITNQTLWSSGKTATIYSEIPDFKCWSKVATQTEIFRGFSQSLQTNADRVLQFRQLTLPEASFPIYFSLTILPLSITQPELLTAFLNKANELNKQQQIFKEHETNASKLTWPQTWLPSNKIGVRIQIERQTGRTVALANG